MADELYNALAGISYDPYETGYGLSQQVLASSLPNLMNPYQSTGTNLGIALGGALLTGLLGYQARQSAAEQSLQANRLALQLMEAPSAAQRLDIIETAPDTIMQGKLLNLNTRLAAQQAAMQQLVAQEVAKQQGLAEFNLGPTGTKLFERRLQEIEAMRIPTRLTEKKDWWEGLSATERSKFGSVIGQTNELRELAQQFRDLDAFGPELRLQALAPGSKADLAMSKMNALVPSTARLLGEVGNLAQQEQERLIDATMGSVLSGSESIAKRLEQLAATSERTVRQQMQAYEKASMGGGSTLLETFGKQTKSPAEQRNEELKARLAKLEALAAQRK